MKLEKRLARLSAAIHKAYAIKLRIAARHGLSNTATSISLLGEIVRRVTKMPLQDFVQREIFGPLKMKDTCFLPLQNRIKLSRIAPTEVVDGKPWRGVVHDPTARHMGGVAGHAGFFQPLPIWRAMHE